MIAVTRAAISKACWASTYSLLHLLVIDTVLFVIKLKQ
jgi:hypothetical protein